MKNRDGVRQCGCCLFKFYCRDAPVGRLENLKNKRRSYVSTRED